MGLGCVRLLTLLVTAPALSFVVLVALAAQA